MDISFLLPTNRNPAFALNVVDTIKSIETNYKLEFLIASPDNIDRKDIIHLKDNIGEGPLPRFNDMARISTGRYIVCLVDDHLPVNQDKFFDFVRFLESDFFTYRRFKITSFNTLHIPQRCPILNESWCGNIVEEHNNRQHITVRFPIIERETWKNQLQEYIFHPRFKYHAGDIWLGFFMGEQEAPCTESIADIQRYVDFPTLFNNQTKADCQLYHTLKLKYLLEGYRQYI